MNILIADDHQLMREGLKTLFKGTPGMNVVAEAANGIDAVRLALKHRPDVAIIDVTMPELNGIDAVRKIHRDAPEVKLLALSMHLEKEFVTDMLNAGASGYVVKQCAYSDLVAALHAVCDGEMYLCPIAATLVVGEYLGNNSRKHASAANHDANQLSMREREVLQLIAEGNSTHEAADKLGISAKTVESHRAHVMKKLDLRSVAALTKYAIRVGITPLDN